MSEAKSFDQCVDVIREKVMTNTYDDEYTDALNTMSVMWDQKRVDEINRAIAPSHSHPIPRERLYILMNAANMSYLILTRDQKGAIFYG